MAFDNGKQGFVWLGKIHPAVEATAVYCDPCAHGGAVPFKVDTCHHCGGAGKQEGGEFTCCDCGKPVHYHQERPWRWSPAGWDKEQDKRSCSKCGGPSASGVAWFNLPQHQQGN